MHSNLIGLLLYYARSTDTRPRACTCMFKRVRYHKQTHKTSLELHLCIFGVAFYFIKYLVTSYITWQSRHNLDNCGLSICVCSVLHIPLHNVM